MDASSFFNIGDPLQIFGLDLLEFEDDDNGDEDLLSVLEENSVNTPDPQADVGSSQNEVSVTEPVPDPQPEPSVMSSRFSNETPDDIMHYYDSTQTKATKTNTKWGVKIIQEWSVEMSGNSIDFDTISTEELAEILTRFYCSAKPQKGDENYHKNTLKSIRSATNRHMQDLGRNVNIVSDSEFKAANRVFSGILKERVRMGDSKPTQHKEIICDDDMLALREYFSAAESNPIILHQFVWFCIAYHFVTRGSETHHQLTPSSFAFRDDGHGEYAVLVHETAQKNHQGGLLDKEENVGKSMYATGGILCPVKCLKLLIEKTDATASKLFNQYNSEAVQLPVSTEIWFTAKSLAKHSFANFMSDISKSAKTSQRYTNHCVRATAIQTLNDANVEARHIMFLSDHANEGSLRSYNRTVSREQKKMLSSTLSKAFSGESSLPLNQERALQPLLPTQIASSRPLALQAPAIVSRREQNATSTTEAGAANNPPISFDVASFNQQSISTCSPGFLSHSVFNNCNFSFNNAK